MDVVNSFLFCKKARRTLRLWTCYVLLAGAGCGYNVGAPFSPEIRTIHVPMFTSSSFRRGWELELTEAVQKEIQNRTHYRLSKEPFAQTRLTGRIIDINKNVVGENRFDDPRQLQVSLAVEITWEDLRTKQLLAQRTVPLDAQSAQLITNAELAPEAGQSLATAKAQIFSRMAKDIVDLMEVEW